MNGYSPEQQQILRLLLSEAGYLSPLAPEGYLSKAKFAEISGFARSAADRAVAEMHDLGDPVVARVQSSEGKTGVIAEVYSPEQQSKMRKWLELNGYQSKKSAIGKLAIHSAE